MGLDPLGKTPELYHAFAVRKNRTTILFCCYAGLSVSADWVIDV